MRDLLAASVAQSSLQLYRRAWTLFRECSSLLSTSNNVLITIPVSGSHVAVFVTYLHSEGYAPTSIISYVSAVGYLHRLLGLQDPTSGTLVQKLLAGAAKVHVPKPPRLPITILILHRMLVDIDSIIHVKYHRLLLKAMFTVAFFGLMRIGEVTMSKNKQIPLKLSQVVFSPDKVTISISLFKHNKSNKPVEVYLERQEDSVVCPVFNLANYVLLRGYAVGPLFAFPDLSPVPRQFFSKNLKLLITFAGLDFSRYLGHSFRIGGASYYAELGYTDAQLRLMGRWGSNAFIKYIRHVRALSPAPGRR